MSKSSAAVKQELLKLLEEKALRVKYNQLDLMFPDEGSLRRELYPKHLEFFAKGATHMQRGVVSANQTGKTTMGCYEDVLHLTGRYPSWWVGMRYNRPIILLIAADRGDAYRDSIQKKLMGNDPSDPGTGLIPRDCIIDTKPLQGTPGGIGQYFIRHVSGGVSQVIVRTYQSGRTAFEAMVLDVIHLDEECPRDIYSECMTRLVTKKDGRIYSTFTPDSGLTDTAVYFLNKEDPNNKHLTQITWKDVPHLSPAVQEILLASYSPHERECRSLGIPFLGAGAIYPVPESIVFEDPFEIPHNWPRAYALDVGRRMTACVWGAYDRESMTWHLYSEHYLGQAVPSVHADAIKARGAWIRGVVDPASHGSNYDGTTLYGIYSALGLDLENANNKVKGDEGGILATFQMLSTGRLRVFNTMRNWQTEYRVYRRDLNGRIVKENDHLMDATRYLVMSGAEVARTEPFGDEDDTFSTPSYSPGRSRIGGY